MVKHPIHVARDTYRGRDSRRRNQQQLHNEQAAELERYINDRLLQQTAPIEDYDYHDIARATGYSLDIVSELCFAIDGGHNGFTAYRHNLSYDEAVRLNGLDT